MTGPARVVVQVVVRGVMRRIPSKGMDVGTWATRQRRWGHVRTVRVSQPHHSTTTPKYMGSCYICRTVRVDRDETATMCKGVQHVTVLDFAPPPPERKLKRRGGERGNRWNANGLVLLTSTPPCLPRIFLAVVFVEEEVPPPPPLPPDRGPRASVNASLWRSDLSLRRIDAESTAIISAKMATTRSNLEIVIFVILNLTFSFQLSSFFLLSRE